MIFQAWTLGPDMNLVNTAALLVRDSGERCHSGCEITKGIYGMRSYSLLRPAILTNIFRYFILANTKITVFERQKKKVNFPHAIREIT